MISNLFTVREPNDHFNSCERTRAGVLGDVGVVRFFVVVVAAIGDGARSWLAGRRRDRYGYQRCGLAS